MGRPPPCVSRYVSGRFILESLITTYSRCQIWISGWNQRFSTGQAISSNRGLISRNCFRYLFYVIQSIFVAERGGRISLFNGRCASSPNAKLIGRWFYFETTTQSPRRGEEYVEKCKKRSEKVIEFSKSQSYVDWCVDFGATDILKILTNVLNWGTFFRAVFYFHGRVASAMALYTIYAIGKQWGRRPDWHARH